MRLPRQPVSDCYGYDRGTPIDRHYIDRFLTHHAEHICGHVLEVKDDTYARRFGGDRVEVTVVDNDHPNPRATLHADIADSRALPGATFDCILLTQTLQLIARPAAVLRNLEQALRRDGALLLTAPTVGRISPSAAGSDHWRITPVGLARLFAETWSGPTTITSYGNFRAYLGALIGEAAEELTITELDELDPRYPLIACAVAQRYR
jgi:SAM-dependent methyltransferase